MRSSSIVMSYLIIGVVVFGGGVIQWGDAGVVTYFAAADGGTFAPAGTALSQLETAGGSLETVVGLAVGMVLVVWNLLINLLAFFHWPIIALNDMNAPPLAVLLLGGGYVGAFYMSVLRTLRLS